MADDFATRAEVAALRRELRHLQAAFAQLSRRREHPDGRLGPLLAMIFAFSRDRPWTAAELIEDARRADPGLWRALDELVGQHGDLVIKLGRWLERHDGIEADGYRLDRIKRDNGAWVYSVAMLEK